MARILLEVILDSFGYATRGGPDYDVDRTTLGRICLQRVDIAYAGVYPNQQSNLTSLRGFVEIMKAVARR